MSDKNDFGMAIGFAGLMTFGLMAIVYCFKLVFHLFSVCGALTELGRIQQEEKRIKDAEEAEASKASSSKVLPFSRPRSSFGSPPASAE